MDVYKSRRKEEDLAHHRGKIRSVISTLFGPIYSSNLKRNWFNDLSKYFESITYVSVNNLHHLGSEGKGWMSINLYK